MIKVLHVINSLKIGGAEKLLSITLPRLKRKGIEVELLILDDSKSIFKEKLELSGIKIHSLKSSNIYSMLNIFKIKPYISTYNIIHTHLFPTQYWVVLAYLLTKRKPYLVTTEHSTSNRRRSFFIFKLLDQIVYSFYRKVICISEGVEKSLKQHCKIENKACVIENGIELNDFILSKGLKRSDLSLKEKDFIVTMVAGFREEKDHETVIKSLEYLPNEVKILFVGDGTKREYYQELTEKMNLKNRVFFLGIRGNINDILYLSDVCVVSSHWEGFGLAAVEAMASHKPVIASNVAGLSDIVKGYGLLFERGDHKMLAAYILKLKEDSSFYCKISTRCSIRSKKYDISIMVDRTVELYEKICKNGAEVN